MGKPEGLLAAAGYFCAANVQHCEAAEIMPYISDSRQRHNLPLEERFKSPPPCPEDPDALTATQHRLRTPAGKALYAKRTSTVETVFGIIKQCWAFGDFTCAGLMRHKVNGIWSVWPGT